MFTFVISQFQSFESSIIPKNYTYFNLNKFCKNFWKIKEIKKEKTSVCTGTHNRSETSLNIVVHENVKLYMNQYVKFFLKFP